MKRSWLREIFRPDGNIVQITFLATLRLMLISELASSLTTMVDGIILARYLDMYSVAAHGLCSPYTSVLKLLIYFFANGTQIACSRASVRGELQEANRIKPGQTIHPGDRLLIPNKDFRQST